MELSGTPGCMNALVLIRTQPDRRLAELAIEGSEAAFEEIVRRYRPGLVSFAGRIASRDSADDVVQDSMVKAHAALRRGDEPESVRAWLFTIVRNTALNSRRDQRLHQELDDSYDGVEQPPEALERRHRIRDLLQALASLPAAQRDAIVQRELEGKGHDEIARSLRVSPGAVRQLIFRARSALRAGAGVVLPMQALRATILSGAADPGGSSAGLGMAAKLGAGALVATGALMAGTGAVKHEVGPGHHSASAAAANARQPKAVSEGAQRVRLPSPANRRQRVVVRPATSSTAQATAPVSRAEGRVTRISQPKPAPHRAQPQPRDGGAPQGAAPWAGPPGGDHPGGPGPLAQASSTTGPGDCPPGEDRDPGQGDVSPS